MFAPRYDEHGVTQIQVFTDGRDLLDDVMADDDVAGSRIHLDLSKTLVLSKFMPPALIQISND